MTGTPKEIQMYRPTSDIDEDEIDLGVLIGVLVEYRWLIILITLIALFIGAFHAYTAIPIYSADGMLQVEERASGLESLDVMTMLEDRSPVAAEIEILRSRSVLGTVVDNLKLDIDVWPEYTPLIGEALARRMDPGERPLARVDTLDVPDSWRGESMQLVISGTNGYELRDVDGELLLRGTVGEVASLSLPGDEKITLFVSVLQGGQGQVFWVQRSPRIDAIQMLQGNLSVIELGDWSGIIGISVESTDPDSVSQQVDEIAKVYVQKNVERKSQEARSTLDFLESQLPAVRQEMEAAELALNAYRLEKGSVDLPLETRAVLQTIVTIEGQLNQLQQEREKVTLAFTTEHPTIIALDRQIDQLNEQLDTLNSQIRDLPSTQQEILRLVRDVEVSSALYTSLLDTQQELRVVEAGTIGNVRVIDYSITPTLPIKPNKLLILTLSGLIGVFLGAVIALARKGLNGGIEDPDLIEKQVNVPVYATVIHSRTQQRLYKALQAKNKKRAILAEESPTDPAIESLRNLRTALHFGMMNTNNNCIMITGPSPAVGKSFISCNLAAVLASNNKKVLLIDGDLRKGSLHNYLGLSRENGLSEFISGDIAIGKALHQSTIPGLMLVPTGALPPNPAELLLHQRFANFLSVLAPRFDHIIVDSPPILAVTDASIIGQLAGGTLMVLKAGEHPMREIEQSVKHLKQANVNLRGIVFNDVIAHSKRYGAGRYSYQYSYEKSRKN
jgi:tyrosine-protein kinase Etk/Wzc